MAALGAEVGRHERWRTGTSLGRTIYAQIGPAPSKADVLLGMMDTRALAELVVSEHNRGLDAASSRR